jgi:hypothetical protein
VSSVVLLADHRQKTLLETLRRKQATLTEVYRAQGRIEEIADKLIDQIKAEFTWREWQDYGRKLDDVWDAARHSDDDMAYAFAVLHEAIKVLEARQ